MPVFLGVCAGVHAPNATPRCRPRGNARRQDAGKARRSCDCVIAPAQRPRLLQAQYWPLHEQRGKRRLHLDQCLPVVSCQLSVVRRWAMGDAAIERPLQMRDQLRRGIAEHLAHHVDVPRGENARHQHALGQFQRRRCIAHARGEWAWIVPKLQRCAIAGTHDLLRRAQLTCVAGSGLLKNAASSTVGSRAVGNRPARPCAGARPWCHTRCVGGLRNTSCDTASVAAAHCAVHTLRSVRYFKDTDSTTQKHSTPSAHPRLPCAHAPHVASR